MEFSYSPWRTAYWSLKGLPIHLCIEDYIECQTDSIKDLQQWITSGMYIADCAVALRFPSGQLSTSVDISRCYEGFYSNLGLSDFRFLFCHNGLNICHNINSKCELVQLKSDSFGAVDFLRFPQIFSKMFKDFQDFQICSKCLILYDCQTFFKIKIF